LEETRALPSVENGTADKLTLSVKAWKVNRKVEEYAYVKPN